MYHKNTGRRGEGKKIADGGGGCLCAQKREIYTLYIYVSQNERIDRRLPPSQ